MNVNPRPKLAFHITEAAYSIVIILWYVLPFINKDIGSFDPRQLAGTLYGSPPAQIGAWILVTAFSYLIPLICLWKIASIFLARQIPFLADPERPVPILLNILSSGFAITLVIMHLVSRAASASYFAAFPPATYAVAGLSIGYNGYFIVMLIMWLSTRDSTYLEYLEFRRTDEDARGRGVLSALQRQGIQRKMLLTFVPLIIVIIFILAFSLLRDFSSTILAAVYANGEGLADRTASVVKANPSDKDRISLDDYFGAEAKKNSATTGQNDFTRFNKLAYYRRDVRGGGFQIWASTDRKQIDERVAQPETALTGITSRYNPTNQTYEFLAPVTLSNVSIGYVMVDYARDVIYEPYFRTQVKVFVIAALFMYAVDLPHLPVRPGHRVPDPLPADERERHRHDPFQHDQGQAADFLRPAAVQGPGEHPGRDQAPLQRGGEHDHGHPRRDSLHLRLDAQARGEGDADHGAEESHVPLHRHPRIHHDQREHDHPTRSWRCSTITSTCSPPSSSETAERWTSSWATRSWRCSRARRRS